MQSLGDIELLRQYSSSGSEAAFEALVNRRIGFVYSAALRQVRNPHTAEEVTQAVFILLARKGREIPNEAALSGWLFNTVRLMAMAQIRLAATRWQHEQEVQMEMKDQSPESEPLWKEISPVLDEALGALGEKDRQAVLLRYFENKTLTEVGNSLAVGEDGARKRVSRALEKLHRFFTRRGISSTTGVLAAALAANSVHAAPAALAKSVTLLAVVQGGVAGGSSLVLTKGVLKFIMWSKTQMAATGVVVAGLAACVVIQHQSNGRLLGQTRQLQQQIGLLQNDNGELSNQLAKTSARVAQAEPPSLELLQLRGEVSALRSRTNDLQKSLAQASRRETPSAAPAQAQPLVPLSADYPRTAEAATQGIFEVLSKGDLEKFVTDFGEPGVPKEFYDKLFGNPQVKDMFTGVTVLGVGQPTNSFASNMYFVPYKIRFRNGQEKEFELHVAQDPQTQKWYFKGGI